ncbi:unnamed protein product [Kluyveromyces dobzhanskii CBS 2104]|uniref:WGS project CCBQ000000000 data, contig 00106 n=1 Tax=Kluyveromyces dobzhanskii CBS 2104 TaxID=1427455 RepID=A0A0A8L8B0_9SACH|nr:unnamed protein product [Kluyveromyces dobzhanskii CBS 2104]
MDYIKIAKVENVIWHKRGISLKGTLHLTTHHLIFTVNNSPREFWVAYPTIASVFKNKGSSLISKYKHHSEWEKEALYADKDIWLFFNIKVITKDYNIFSLDLESEKNAQDIYDSLCKLTILDDVHKLYAFIYSPNKAETPFDSWNIYNPIKEFQRQGLNFNNEEDCSWRVTDVNEDYSFCRTYPSKLVVPSTVSDTLLSYSVKYRSQHRIPALTYYYSKNGSSITRCSQPLPGITQQRSIQDEKLLKEIFDCAEYKSSKNIIVDARPTTNAMAQTALGGGTENMDNYGFNQTCSRMFLGIDNIHVMRDSLNTLVDNFLVDNDLYLPIDKNVLNSDKSNSWLKYIKLLLSSTDTLVKSIVFNNSNILVHCSDGWDRTAQITSLLQLSLDPYYRTIEGFMVLVEKDWLSFGHRFCERSGHLSSQSVFHDNSTRLSISLAAETLSLNDKRENELGDFSTLNSPETKISSAFKKLRNGTNIKLTSPVFQQFLDCVHQLLIQNPTRFEFNERFLRRLVYHLYSCQYGTFLFDNEYERSSNHASKQTRSVWDYFRSRTSEFTNPSYNSSSDSEEDWILPDWEKVEWWWQLFGRKDEEMNGPCRDEDDQSTLAKKPHSTVQGLKIPKFSLKIFSKK